MLYDCKSLLFLNLKSFIEKSDVSVSGIISNEQQNLTYCINSGNSPKIYNVFQRKNFINNCENNCFKGATKIIIEKKICIENCADDDTYIYEKNNICVENNPNNILSTIIESSESFKTSDNSKSLESSVILESSEISKNQNSQSTIISQLPENPLILKHN